MPLKPGDIVMLNQEYGNREPGFIGYVVKVIPKQSFDSDNLIRVVSPMLAKPMECYAFRVDKIGEASADNA